MLFATRMAALARTRRRGRIATRIATKFLSRRRLTVTLRMCALFLHDSPPGVRNRALPRIDVRGEKPYVCLLTVTMTDGPQGLPSVAMHVGCRGRPTRAN